MSKDKKNISPQRKSKATEHYTTPDKQKAFVEALVHTGGNRQLACERASQQLGVKVSRSSVYHWLKNNQSFAKKVAEANQIGDSITVDLAQSTLVQRTQGMYYKEQVVVKVKVDKYKERVEVKEVKKYLPPDYHAAKILLSAKAQHLGYGTQKVEHSGEITTKNVQVVIANPYENEIDDNENKEGAATDDE
ncbi:hypothetical protein [Microscilla marina]|uniref:Terminase small subunit n=1 Tax=Microscilla marina ATCC 23134 TaxID=313606 RepID=A1ZMN9_MICM2|nr:hypothetical protein [Microscilla marina]EAY28419.1 hypothetical protein M23134_03971 [Microscilla marina ATCC 23134]